MNYLKHYIKLIRKAENRNLPKSIIIEKHHVFPKSIFGDNNRLVCLTLKEHYIAHALLEKVYIKRYGRNGKNTHKMIRAFFIMNNMKNHKVSHLYVNNKKRYRDMVVGVPRTEEVKQKIRKPKKEGHGEAVSKSRKGIKFTKEHRNNLSRAHEKRTIYAKGYNLTEEHKEKLREVDRSYTQTEEYRQKMSLISKKSWQKRKSLNAS